MHRVTLLTTMSHYNILCLYIRSSAVFQFFAYMYVVIVKGDDTVSFETIGRGYLLAEIGIIPVKKG